MRILVTGGSGAFGSAFVKRCIKDPLVTWIAVYSRGEHRQQELQAELGDVPGDRLRFFIGDVRDKPRLCIAMWSATHVAHAAALKVVPWCEYNPSEAVKTNVIGAMNVVECAMMVPDVVKVVGISSDKSCSPTSLYGASKLCAEKLFTAAHEIGGGPSFTVVRYGNVTGSTGSVVPFWRSRVHEGPLPITDPMMTRFWMTLPEAVALVMTELTSPGGGDVVIPKLPSYNVMHLAKAVGMEAGFQDVDVEAVGIRPAEKMHESMVSKDEAPWTTDCGGTYRIHRSTDPIAGGAVSEVERGEPVPPNFQFTSDRNNQWLTARDLQELLKAIP